MKTIVLFYTFGGSTKAKAQEIAKERQATLCEVEEIKNRGVFSALFSGCPKASSRKASKIKPISCDLTEYDRIVIGGPIWAGYPAPALNAILELLPSGKEVEIFLCSGGGEARKSVEGTKDMIAQKGCKLISYSDIKTGQGMKKQKKSK